MKYNHEKPEANLLETEKNKKTVKSPKKAKNSKKQKMTIYIIFPEKITICCCLRLIYIIFDRNT